MKKKFNEKAVGLLLVVAGLLGLAMGWRPVEPSAKPDTSGSIVAEDGQSSSGHRLSCKVLTVYDGDTLGCDLDQDGKIQRPHEEIRLLGIDSPEMHYSKKNPSYGSKNPVDEPLAKEASQWLERRTRHKTVYLEFDKRRHDRYRRTLAFVYAESQSSVSLNEQAVSAGLAMILFIGKNRLHEERFQQAENEARAAKRGVWAAR